MGLRLTLIGIGVLVAGSAAGQVVVTGQVALTGVVETVTGEGRTIRDPDGGRHQVRVQGKKQQGIALADGSLLAAPVEVSVRGEVPAAGLKPGQVVRFRCRAALSAVCRRLDRAGRQRRRGHGHDPPGSVTGRASGPLPRPAVNAGGLRDTAE